MRPKLILALACACALLAAMACAATIQAETTPEPPTTTTAADPAEVPDLLQRELQRMIDRYRHETWRWQRTMGARLTRELGNPPAVPQLKIAAWKVVASKTRRAAQNPPHKRQWLCIHRFEGAWTANTGNGYYGGLQMDITFQRRYGGDLLRRKGTANRWSALEQMWTAERAHRSGLGFYPWPNTARSCGLL